MDRIKFFGFSDEIVPALKRQIRIRHREPEIFLLENVFAVPGLQALYDADGFMINCSNRAILPTDIDIHPDWLADALRKEYRFSPARTVLADDYDVVDEEVFFAGTLFEHYGHFLTDSMARLWCVDRFPDYPVYYLLSSQKEPTDRAYMNHVFHGLGIDHRIRFVKRPTLFRRVRCPFPAMEHSYAAHPVFHKPHLQVAERTVVRKDFSGRPVYLSRRLLKTDPRKVSNEHELEDLFRSNGFQIVYPEELPMPEQIDIFNSAPIIVGLIGSALHTALFSQSDFRGRIAILTWLQPVPRFLLVDAIKNYEAIYLNCLSAETTETGFKTELNIGLAIELLKDAGLIKRAN